MNESFEPAWPNIAVMTASAAERFADRTAIVDGAERTSYAELYAEARRFGAALVAAGVEPRDRVGIWAPNGRDWIVALLGLYQAGATLVPVNTRFKGQEAADILRRAKVKVLVTVTEFLGNDYVAMLTGSGASLPDLRTIVIARGEQSDPGETWAGFMARGTDDGLAEVDRRRAALGPDDPSDVLFTSGTTGTPKGVLMTHRRAMGVGADWVAMAGLTADDRYVLVNPFFHMFGFKGGILACVAAGAAMLPQPVLDVDRVLGQVAEEGVTVLPGPPALYHSILEHADRDRYDLTSLRVAVTGAADIPVELIRRVREELPFSMIVAGYGLTEAGTATSTSPDDDPETIATTVGRPRPGFEIRIADAAGADVAPGEVGEIVLRGPTTMVGYLDDPAATEAVLSADGWLRTGDLGRLDESGCLRIAGRSKDMFIVGGFNAYPAEIEAMLLEHPGVRQVAVIGVPDERLGQVGMAFVVPRSPALDGAGVIAWCRERMANYKVPRFVELIDELPLTESGKVRKNALEARAAGRPG
ncbi:FadD3 family acyl-CoA ligase [Actinomadura chokoriensis]|uniref:FadD3 family acyl-CoA ligase n=1 Tax=Actinomadura chokoriensis TaxID=454156 RepID=A0ABV4QTU0_9ACTN